MRIERYTFEHANDFHAILKCEYCEHSQELKSGYHDGYYHNYVLPAIACKTCGKSSLTGADVSGSPVASDHHS